MKSAYELAMEKLSKAAPTVTLSAEQKAELAELESKCAAKIAEREDVLRTYRLSRARADSVFTRLDSEINDALRGEATPK